MSYNSRTNFATPDDNELPIDEFIKLFTFALNSAVIEPPKNLCCAHNRNGKPCEFEAHYLHHISPDDKQIQLCGLHEREFQRKFLKGIKRGNYRNETQ